MENSRKQLNYREALLKATELCSHSEKCAFDIELKCREWQLSSEETTKVTEFLIQEKYIDHQRYANSFVSDKFKLNKWGKIKIAYPLRQKHLGNALIQSALDSLDDVIYLEVLSELLSVKAKTVKEKDPYSRRSKLLAFAQSRGFEVDLALKVMEKI